MKSYKQSKIRNRYDWNVWGEIQIHDSIFRRVQHRTLLRPQITEYRGQIIRLLNDVSYSKQVTLQEILKSSRTFQRLYGHSTLRTLVIPPYSLEFRRRIQEVSSVTQFMQHFGIGYFRLRPGPLYFNTQNKHEIVLFSKSSWSALRTNQPPIRGNRTVFIVASPSSAEVKNAWSCISIFAYAFKACVRTTSPSSFLSPFYYGVFWLYYHSFSTAQVTSNGWMGVNEQGRMWKEADAKYFKDAVLAFVWFEWGTVQKITVMTASLRAGNQTWNLPNTKKLW
jgi:hypothetical protein